MSLLHHLHSPLTRQGNKCEQIGASPVKQITMADQERGTHSCHIEHSVRPNKGSSKGTFQGRIATQPGSMCRRMVTVSSTMRIPNMKRGRIQPSSFLPHSLVGSVLIIPLVNKRKQIANLESEQPEKAWNPTINLTDKVLFS